MNETAIPIQLEYRGELCSLVKSTYRAGGGTALCMLDRMGLPYMTCTVNIPERPLPAGQIYIKNWSENEGILEALVKAGFVRDTKKAVVTGRTFANICELLI